MAERFERRAGVDIVLRQGDLTEAEVDAVVNAANERMLGGGGVDGAVHRAAGPELLTACRAVPEVRPGVRCPTGEARITPGFGLRASWVIHTVGPVYRGRREDAELLGRAHRSALELAESRGLRSLSFPAISCGVYGYPPEEAAPIAIGVVREREWRLDQVVFVLFTEDLLRTFSRAAAVSPSPG
ncbi:MAG TPA: O-acetyl-ADP-ribose deacetylase [Thermoanaerobaculia bacterium]|nr:O-acetyl-ADP-ribose deacetylase [Thermoanaerobaculia bacterium]